MLGSPSLSVAMVVDRWRPAFALYHDGELTWLWYAWYALIIISRLVVHGHRFTAARLLTFVMSPRRAFASKAGVRPRRPRMVGAEGCAPVHLDG